jgi:hypothetical protein
MIHITNNYKNAEQNGDDAQKTILPRMWSTDHIENYISFTNPPEFRINPDYPYENDLERYGIDISQLTEDYNKAVAQLKNEFKKLFQNLTSLYANKLTIVAM